MKKSFKYWMLMVPVVLGLAAMMTSCSGLIDAILGNEDNPVSSNTQNNDILEKGALDIIHGETFRVFYTDQLDSYKLPLATLEEIQLDISENDYYDAKIEEIDGVKYIMPVQKKPQTDPVHIVRAKITPKQKPELARNVFFVFRSPDSQDTPNLTRNESDNTNTSGKEKVYKKYIGKSTYYFNNVGTPHSTIISYDVISKLKDNMLIESEPQLKEFHLEENGYTLDETTESYSVNIGVSFKKTRKSSWEELAPDGLSILSKSSSTSYSGSLDFGISQSWSQSSSYEYAINMYRVQLADLRFAIEKFEAGANGKVPDTLMMAITDKTFQEYLTKACKDTLNFDADAFYDYWGTDLITQGRFGGGYYYIYGRDQNSYETTIDIDAKASFKITHPGSGNSSSGQLVQIFMMQNSDYEAIEASMAYNEENYHEAARAQTFEMSFGGAVYANTDLDTWLKGFDDPANWGLMSYHIDDDKDDGPYLYPLDQYIINLAGAFYLNIPENERTEGDLDAFSRQYTIAQKLQKARDKYIEKYTYSMSGSSRLVIADIMAVNLEGKDRHPDGEPKAMVKEFSNSRTSDDKYLIYYPVMANYYAVTDKGYALEVAQEDYINVDRDRDQYFYYALAPADKTWGITDILLEGDDWTKENKDGNYQHRGVSSYVGDNEDDNYVQVKWWEETEADSLKITAVGFSFHYDENPKKIDPTYIFASTGGSEMKRPLESSSNQKKFKEFWNWYHVENNMNIWHDQKHKMTQFFAVFSRKDLQANDKGRLEVTQPLKWGEQ